jgi:16S rRNA (guanine527-N7)-methyltransferase
VQDELLERWLEGVLATPGLTAISDPAEARARLVDDALRAAPLVGAAAGQVLDVGSGGGSPGIPLARALPERSFTLLEAARRKCEFLERAAAELPNVEVVWGRAEEQPIDGFGVALAKALAKPPVAAELCLPLVREGGVALLWVGETADAHGVEQVAEQLAAALERDVDGLLVLRKLGPTPAGFPRRPGMAKKRPLA